MPSSVNQAIVLLAIFIFGLVEDIWFDRILQYQLIAQSEKTNKNVQKTKRRFNALRKKYVWILQSFGLCSIVISFSNTLTDDISWILFIGGSIFCIIYFQIKIQSYVETARFIKCDDEQ